MKTKMTNRTKALLMTKKGEINQQIKRMISNCHFGNDCKIYPKYYRQRLAAVWELELQMFNT